MRASRVALRSFWADIQANLQGIREGLASVQQPVNDLHELTLWECPPNQEISEGWELLSDKSIGGSSECALEWVAEDPEDSSGSARFAGVLSADTGTNQKLAKSGFCAARFRLPPRAEDLGEYEGLAMRVKTDGRIYTVNVQCDTWFKEDLYQGFIVTPPDEWVTVELPFDQFLQTAAGYYRIDQRVFDPATLATFALCLTSVHAPSVGAGVEGAPMAGAVSAAAAVEEKLPDDGPFCIQLQWVKAMHKLSHTASVGGQMSKKEEHLYGRAQLQNNPLPDHLRRRPSEGE